MNWHNCTAIITGAYGGLGKALSLELSSRGCALILVGRDAEKLQAMVDWLPGQALWLDGDVSDPALGPRLLSLVQQNNNRTHVLINNAAVSASGFLPHLPAERLQQLMQVNLLAPMLLTQALLPWLKSAARGRVINIGSTFGAIGYPGFSAYCASKFGLRGFTQALNRELTGTAVRAAYLAPRAMQTAINSDAVTRMNSRLGNTMDRPEDIAPRVIKAIEKDRREVFFGWPEKLFCKVNALLPGAVDKAIGKDHAVIHQQLHPDAEAKTG